MDDHEDPGSTVSSQDPSWKKIKLSLERPYKDDSGAHIPVLLDLLPDGQQIFEPQETAASRLETNLLRIFHERGHDFFEKPPDLRFVNDAANGSQTGGLEEKDDDEKPDADLVSKPMPAAELVEMKKQLDLQLNVAWGEMTLAQDLLTGLLAGTHPDPTEPPLISSVIVSNPRPITSLEAFNAQLILGSKDESLRKAASVFKTAAESVERMQTKSEKYWLDGLRIRQSNWGLIPAPLPPGSAMGKGADRTTKDFVISYGLEGSPAAFRRRAIGQLATTPGQEDIDFPMHQKSRLQIGLRVKAGTGSETRGTYTSPSHTSGHKLDRILYDAQTEIFDQEVFSILVKEAGNLPTAPTRVSERLIVVDAAEDITLEFALVDTVPEATVGTHPYECDLCELIYHALQALVITQHGRRQKQKSAIPAPSHLPSTILQPVVNILQYRVFCRRIHSNLASAARGLSDAGIDSQLDFTAVSETGEEILGLLDNDKGQILTGEATINISDWHLIRLTFASPSSLVAHLSQATLGIVSLQQLSQLLMDEAEKCLLQQIVKLGKELCQGFDSVWFIDLNRCVAKWEGCVLTFSLSFAPDFTLGCSAFRLDESTGKRGAQQSYTSEMPFFGWIASVVSWAHGHVT